MKGRQELLPWASAHYDSLNGARRLCTTRRGDLHRFREQAGLDPLQLLGNECLTVHDPCLFMLPCHEGSRFSRSANLGLDVGRGYQGPHHDDAVNACQTHECNASAECVVASTGCEGASTSKRDGSIRAISAWRWLMCGGLMVEVGTVG